MKLQSWGDSQGFKIFHFSQIIPCRDTLLLAVFRFLSVPFLFILTNMLKRHTLVKCHIDKPILIQPQTSQVTLETVKGVSDPPGEVCSLFEIKLLSVRLC